MKIMTDTSSLYSPKEGNELGIKVLPLCVTINKETWKEFVDIDAKEFIKKVRDGGIPISSQPSVGETIEIFENETDDLLVISMADGLSGTYQSTVGARESIDKNDHIHCINSKTLCGPHRYMVKKAIEMRDAGKEFIEIKNEMLRLADNNISFLIPSDFDFLKRGGRLTPAAAAILGMLKIYPVMTQTEDGRRLEKFAMKRTLKAAVNEVSKKLEEFGAAENCLISISHADVEEQAKDVMGWIEKKFPNAQIELLELSPAFITQGGPGCIAIQAVKL